MHLPYWGHWLFSNTYKPFTHHWDKRLLGSLHAPVSSVIPVRQLRLLASLKQAIYSAQLSFIAVNHHEPPAGVHCSAPLVSLHSSCENKHVHFQFFSSLPSLVLLQAVTVVTRKSDLHYRIISRLWKLFFFFFLWCLLKKQQQLDLCYLSHSKLEFKHATLF